MKDWPWIRLFAEWGADYAASQAREAFLDNFHHPFGGHALGGSPPCGPTPAEIARDKGPAGLAHSGNHLASDNQEEKGRNKTFAQRELEREQKSKQGSGDQSGPRRGRVLPDEQLENDKGRDR